MKKSIHDYFGITEVKAIETGEPQLMIVAGITSKESEMCLQVRGGSVVLGSCTSALEEGDGRSTWAAEANSQLPKAVHGSEPGTGDIAAETGASARSSSTAAGEHGPPLALDRDVNTFWASGAFPDAEEHVVTFDLDLGKKARLAAVRIDWEYPPMAYKLQLSTDGSLYS
ncbi:LOW QUALITY PROTEIN: CpCCp1/Cpa135, related [Eimeria mitis]|uniref:CpCCp1/Cpa135, related n=1 Tax=Eimeria mitis TaxID=44415 RepID=U6K8K5_9EIME|nr:LOW QUALITY PROTEIN: CpCCp1/Cpa135, related [Eimeria mitis]CDJ33161.1 CpCCp1/Cpa135, related [Eimeria mitis]